MGRIYQFTGEQLANLLQEHIQLFWEYRDGYGYSEESSASRAASQTLEGVDAAWDLYVAGENDDPHVKVVDEQQEAG